ncbi:MAG: hypothetical protein Q9228_001545 [Teloschistes exilis]
MSASPAASVADLQSPTQPPKSEKEQITFRFCRECSNMLYAKEDRINNKLMFACRTCQYSEDAVSSCVYRNSIYNIIGETAGVTQDVGSDPTVGLPDVTCTLCGQEITCDICGGVNDGGIASWGCNLEGDEGSGEDEYGGEDNREGAADALPRSNKRCPKCAENEAVFFQSQQRSAETGMFRPNNSCTAEFSVARPMERRMAASRLLEKELTVDPRPYRLPILSNQGASVIVELDDHAVFPLHLVYSVSSQQHRSGSLKLPRCLDTLVAIDNSSKMQFYSVSTTFTLLSYVRLITMPRKKEVLDAPKKGGLTLTQLASYDDILTDALVDHVYFWTAIRKNRSKYNLTRGISEDDVTKILLHQVIVDKNMPKAESSLLQLPGLRKFHAALKTDREKQYFRAHMQRYISIWLPECPFEVSTTNRYTIVAEEAAVIARQDIAKGETVKYLVGSLVPLTPEEEKDLGLRRRDFSIVVSSRKKTPCLFLGPARFANHDCNANAKLVARPPTGMEIHAIRPIAAGEEITVTYGDNYFGEGNCECLCLTCEKHGRGKWIAPATIGCGTPLSDEDDQASSGYSLRGSTRKRTRMSEFSASPHLDLDESSPRKKPRRNVAEHPSPLASDPVDIICKGTVRNTKKRPRPDDETISVKVEPGEDSPCKRKKMETLESHLSLDSVPDEGMVPGSLKVPDLETEENLTSIRLQDKKVLPQLRMPTSTSPMADSIYDELSAALKKKPTKATAGDRIEDPPLSDSPSILTKGKVKIMELVPPTPSENNASSALGCARPTETPISASDHDSLFDRGNPLASSQATTPGPSEEVESRSKSTAQPKAENSDSELSELDPDVELDDSSMTVIEQGPKRKKAARGSKILPTIEVEDASLRSPGDYTRTPLLLGETYSRWVDCRTCSGCWVQRNGYQTRKECPRCERHSKLYGFQWPKTDNKDSDDDEERVMDHRTVHRFIRPEEERLLVKKGKGCLRAGSGSTSRTQSLPTEIDKGPISRLRGSRRGSNLKH